MAAGVRLTFTTNVLKQPVGNVYLMVVEPTVSAVKAPVSGSIVPTAVAELVHVPPVGVVE